MLIDKEIITLVDENDEECTYVVIDGEFICDGNRYALLMDLVDFEEFENGEVDQDVILMRVEEDENGEDVLVEIDDDEEFNMVCDYLDKMELESVEE